MMIRLIDWRAGAMLATVLGAFYGCAPATAVSSTAQEINGGVNDTTHLNVVGILIQGSGGYGSCTGSLIAPNLVLTARHCVSELTGEGIVCSAFTEGTTTYTPTTAAAPYSARSFGVTTDAVIGPRSSFVGVAAVLVPPNSTGVPMCGKDIALLRLSESITDVGLVVPKLDTQPRENDVFTASGYGATNGSGGGSGTRRMRSGLLVQHVGEAYARRDVMVLATQELLADTGTCQGDSGGPALDELGEVFGVLSRGAATTCDSPVYTRVDSYAAWIRAQATAAANVGGYEPPSWVTPPVPNTSQLGDECRSDEQCVAPYTCVPVNGARRCTIENCDMCPGGWVCNATMTACMPDPSATPPDSGTTPPPEAGATPTPDGGMMMPPMRTGHCSVNNTSPTSRTPMGAMALALGAVAVALGARRRLR